MIPPYQAVALDTAAMLPTATWHRVTNARRQACNIYTSHLFHNYIRRPCRLVPIDKPWPCATIG